MKAIMLNLVLAAGWLLLEQTASAAAFLRAWLLGFAVIATFRRVLGLQDYVRRAIAFVRFALLFAWEFLLANVSVAQTVLLRSREELHPNFITYDVSGLSRAEILLVSFIITMMPGTSAVRLDPDGHTLILHALDAAQPQQIRASIDRRLRQPILEFSR